MDFPWPTPSGEQPSNGELNLLVDNNLLLDLDDKTLQCLIGGAPLPVGTEPEAEADGAGPSDNSKRRRTHDNFNSWLSDFARDGEADEAGEDCDAGPSKKVGKRGRPMSDAAVAKAQRERARRERLNDYFDELARLCDPSGKSVKGDRVSVVADAIRVVQQLRVENNQLRQLNKFLEERTSELERSRAQTMYQHVATAGHHQASTSAAGGMGAGVPHVQPVQHVLVQVPVGSTLGAQLLGFKQDHVMPVAGGGVAGGDAAACGHAAGSSLQAAPAGEAMPPGAPAVAWLPAPDLTYDQKLRPPAA